MATDINRILDYNKESSKIKNVLVKGRAATGKSSAVAFLMGEAAKDGVPVHAYSADGDAFAFDLGFQGDVSFHSRYRDILELVEIELTARQSGENTQDPVLFVFDGLEGVLWPGNFEHLDAQLLEALAEGPDLGIYFVASISTRRDLSFKESIDSVESPLKGLFQTNITMRGKMDHPTDLYGVVERPESIPLPFAFPPRVSRP